MNQKKTVFSPQTYGARKPVLNKTLPQRNPNLRESHMDSNTRDSEYAFTRQVGAIGSPTLVSNQNSQGGSHHRAPAYGGVSQGDGDQYSREYRFMTSVPDFGSDANRIVTKTGGYSTVKSRQPLYKFVRGENVGVGGGREAGRYAGGDGRGVRSNYSRSPTKYVNNAGGRYEGNVVYLKNGGGRKI
jgi:hypothetical protein